MKKIAFLTHEFGLFKGHGGVATYLNVLVDQILKRNDNYEVYVFSIYSADCHDLKKESRLHLIQILGNTTHEQGKYILSQLIKIKPDYVECADYLALGLESLVYRMETTENELTETVFSTIHHTATRECFEWNTLVPVKYASHFEQDCFVRERTQMKLCDVNIAPSSFMNKYVSHNYCLRDVKTILHPIVVNQKKKQDIIKIIEKEFDIGEYKDKFVISCISRIEGRKNQGLLVEQFVKFLSKTGADALLILAGNSSVNPVTNREFRSEIFDEIPEKYINNISFYDFVGENGKNQLYSVSDVSILASTYECLSLAMVESVLNEVPVICSVYCGFSDYMESTRDAMTFDPFSDEDLSKKIEMFYNASISERNKIIAQQVAGLHRLASYTETVDKRMRLYETIQKKKILNEHRTIIIDERNYLNVVTEETIQKEFDCVLVDFYFDKTLTVSLMSLFLRVCDKFEKGDIISYSGANIQRCYINLLMDHIPFFVIGIKISNADIGKRIIDAFLGHIESEQPVFNLLDMREHLRDQTYEEPTNILIEKRVSFSTALIASAFMAQNKMDLETLT